MSKAQNSRCTCPTSTVSVKLPAYLAEALQRHAEATGNTVDQLVEAAFAHVGNVVDPCIRVR